MGQIELEPASTAFREDAASVYTETEDGISLYTQQSDDEIHDTPPAYSHTSGSVNQPLLPLPSAHRSLRKEIETRPFKQYAGLEMIMDARFDTDPVYAEEAVREWCSIPAEQMIKIRGTHTNDSHGAMKGDKTVVDFDIEIPLVNYLVDHAGRNNWSQLAIADNNKTTYRGGILKSRGPTQRGGQDTEAFTVDYPKISLTAWLHLFCASHSSLKSFRIKRTVSGLNTNYLNSAIRALVSSTNYRGHTSITFPINNAATELHATHPINSWRFNQWICILFYVTFLWIFTWPYLFLATRKWAVVDVDWPWSVTDEHGVRSYASMSEEEWFARWGPYVKTAVLAKKKGPLTGHDLIASEMQPHSFRSGSAAVDRVVEVVGAGIRGAHELRRQWGWGGDC